MDNYNGFSYQPNMYYQSVQPTQTYNNYRGYQQQTPTPAYYNPNLYQPSNTNLIWVQGESGAKGQNVPNGCTMAFFDSENPCIYIKSVDMSGKPSLTTLTYNDNSENNIVASDEKCEYVTKEQFDDIAAQLSSINKKIDTFNSYVTKDQLNLLNGHINDLSDQVKDIEDRITSFGKPQQTNSTTRRVNK